MLRFLVWLNETRQNMPLPLSATQIVIIQILFGIIMIIECCYLHRWMDIWRRRRAMKDVWTSMKTVSCKNKCLTRLLCQREVNGWHRIDRWTTTNDEQREGERQRENFTLHRCVRCRLMPFVSSSSDDWLIVSLIDCKGYFAQHTTCKRIKTNWIVHVIDKTKRCWPDHHDGEIE